MKVLIVDDEPLAREGLVLMLKKHDDLDIAGFSSDGMEAVDAIRSLAPDLVFMDINMPGMNGLEVLETVGVQQMPRVIFLTAYDEYAVDAFRVNALDYLLKPVSEEQLAESLDRARLLDRDCLQSRLNALLQKLQPVNEDKSSERIVVRTDGHVHFLRPEEIIRVEAVGDYINIHARDRSHLVRETMKNMEVKLQGKGFQRIHRSSIVNLEEISELVSNDNGDYDVVLKDGTTLKLSRTYRDELYRKMAR